MAQRSHGRVALPWLLGIGLWACAAEPDPSDTRRPARGRMTVAILDPWFVDVDGERVAIDEFLYRMRESCRAWSADGKAAPPVLITWEEADLGVTTWPELKRQLRLAGVTRIDVGAAE